MTITKEMYPLPDGRTLIKVLINGESLVNTAGLTIDVYAGMIERVISFHRTGSLTQSTYKLQVTREHYSEDVVNDTTLSASSDITHVLDSGNDGSKNCAGSKLRILWTTTDTTAQIVTGTVYVYTR